jgi:poly-gamma-glutamate capsule biosynthesis protein CapA/YwtB (metallophosphatase superfamily)
MPWRGSHPRAEAGRKGTLNRPGAVVRSFAHKPAGTARLGKEDILRKRARIAVLAIFFMAAGAFADLRVAAATILSDFESGSVTLESYDPAEDLSPDSWSLTTTNTHDGSEYSLRIYGNTWKAQPIEPYLISQDAVFRVAVYVESKAEMQGFGISDGTNSLLYAVAGTQMPTDPMWDVAYEGAFSTGAWHVYMLPVGSDWFARYGYNPAITRLVFLNDRDAGSGAAVFDDVEDVTADLPSPPEVHIVTGAQKTTQLGARLFLVGVQFHAQVFDSDSDTLYHHWDFGDSTTSAETDPFHEFLVAADYTFTVSLQVQDDTGLWGRDSTQVTVDPGGPGAPLTINFVGDVMLARNYDTPGGLIDTQGVEAIFEPTRAVYGDAADVSVCNLECPLTDEGTQHPTKSIVFRGRPANVAGLTYAGIDVVSLGNNHIIDYGQRGMEETIEVLEANALRHSGAGDNEYFALEPVMWTERGVALAFLGQCNRTGREYNYQPFLDAAYNKPGFAYLIEPNLSNAIEEASMMADLVVIQMHAGIEYTTAPSKDGPPIEPSFDAIGPEPGRPEPRFITEPTLAERQLRWGAVDAGADLVICHHPHVLQGFEVHRGVLIAHSLGNFVFDQSYAETFPSLVLSAVFDKTSFRSFTFRPAFVDHMIPRPATGRLGREILDREAEYSRPLGAVISTDPQNSVATIHLDPGAVVWTPSEWSRRVPLVAETGGFVTPPIERPGAGMLSRVLSVEGGAGIEVRVGREILWHGDFEAEGASLWNLNSSDEVYDTSITHQGLRSLRQRRTSSNTGAVTTDLEGYPAAIGGTDYSVCGWIKTENATNARITARLFTGRGSGQVGNADAGAPLSGTNDWTWTWANFQTSSAASYLNLRPQMDKPASGESFAWYDEARIVSWEAWQSASLPLPVSYPGSARFIQVRSAEAADSVLVSWEDVQVGEPAVSVADSEGPGAPPLPLLRSPYPNPTPVKTAIEYVLAKPSRVRLEIFDVTGRRVAVLADETRPAGVHRAEWDARGAASGLYFCRLDAAGAVRTRKLVVMR